MKNADPKSARSKRRNNRGFVSLEKSCRKHRRANRRTMIACHIKGTQHKPGDKVQVTTKTTQTAGGSIQYH